MRLRSRPLSRRRDGLGELLFESDNLRAGRHPPRSERVGDFAQFVVADIGYGTPFAMDLQYRVAFVFFMVGFAQLRDEEDTQDARSAAFIGKFTQQLMTLS